MARHPWLAAALVAALAALPLTVPTATAQPGPGVGWVRLGHLSPEVPPVDIYFAPFGQHERVVIRKAGYGAVTPYSSLPPGAYTVSMRPAGAAQSTPPALNATIQLAEGTAYSLLVFATGPGGQLRGDLVTDDLRAPDAGHGRVRIVQGSAGLAPVTVTMADGQALGTDVAYGMTTPYAQVPAGTAAVRLSAGAVESPSTIEVAAGGTTTLLVTEQGDTLVATPVSDSAGPASTPILGVATGGGGTAPTTPVLPLAAGFAALLVMALLAIRRRAR